MTLTLTLTFNLKDSQPWPKGHAMRTTFNLGQKAMLREQPWPKGHATRTTINNY
ncbi:MAG: hypothetical protein F6J98_10670 [Moorea sp. SIO4G2]|uniref:hypothetical protein n=1 Tax=unclassified Moorena TaxID=2683338 RepID=UPI0013FB85FD|nr:MULTISPECIES: hypothetical protein [unclassified Moorena]NEO12208.1 hypothetical protein [Moorena sp. SIO3E8]NEO60872.1 hypothetical protein [Moorena sp. SIO4G2]NEP97727.1 hypothetical protein [Moorena sp. SIO3F7]